MEDPLISAAPTQRTLADLLAMTPEELSKVDIAEMSTLAIQGFSKDGNPVDAPTTLAEMAKLAESCQPYWGTRDHGGPKDRVAAMALLNSFRRLPASAPIPPLIAYISVGRRLGFPLRMATTAEGALRIHWASDDGGWLLDPCAEAPAFYREEQTDTPAEGADAAERQPDFYVFTTADEFAFALANRGELMLEESRKQSVAAPILAWATSRRSRLRLN